MIKRNPVCHILTVLALLANVIGLSPTAYATEEFRLPAPGGMVHLSLKFNPPELKGIKVHTDNPFLFDFILDKGDSRLSNTQAKDESARLIKYFLASLTVPEKDLWVNLSPYEKNRIIPESLGLTIMGRDLLAEDYMLKQITASLIYPEDETGKKFWKRIYEEAQKKFGTTNIPVNTFNKVWIVPEKAVVYENSKAGTAYIVDSKLKVMLEQDYLALEKNTEKNGSFPNASIGNPEIAQTLDPRQKHSGVTDESSLGSQIIREIVIPELTKEVNGGKNFGELRQVYNSLILAAWYKKKIKDSILVQVYEDKNKVAGVNINDPQEKQKIYQQYLQAFKKGVYNYIKEEQDPMTQEIVSRKYFSGGFAATHLSDLAMTITDKPGQLPNSAMDVTVNMSVVKNVIQIPNLNRLVEGQGHPIAKVEQSEIRDYFYAKLKEQYPSLDDAAMSGGPIYLQEVMETINFSTLRDYSHGQIGNVIRNIFKYFESLKPDLENEITEGQERHVIEGIIEKQKRFWSSLTQLTPETRQNIFGQEGIGEFSQENLNRFLIVRLPRYLAQFGIYSQNMFNFINSSKHKTLLVVYTLDFYEINSISSPSIQYLRGQRVTAHEIRIGKPLSIDGQSYPNSLELPIAQTNYGNIIINGSELWKAREAQLFETVKNSENTLNMVVNFTIPQILQLVNSGSIDPLMINSVMLLVKAKDYINRRNRQDIRRDITQNIEYHEVEHIRSFAGNKIVFRYPQNQDNEDSADEGIFTLMLPEEIGTTFSELMHAEPIHTFLQINENIRNPKRDPKDFYQASAFYFFNRMVETIEQNPALYGFTVVFGFPVRPQIQAQMFTLVDRDKRKVLWKIIEEVERKAASEKDLVSKARADMDMAMNIVPFAGESSIKFLLTLGQLDGAWRGILPPDPIKKKLFVDADESRAGLISALIGRNLDDLSDKEAYVVLTQILSLDSKELETLTAPVVGGYASSVFLYAQQLLKRVYGQDALPVFLKLLENMSNKNQEDIDWEGDHLLRYLMGLLDYKDINLLKKVLVLLEKENVSKALHVYASYSDFKNKIKAALTHGNVLSQQNAYQETLPATQDLAGRWHSIQEERQQELREIYQRKNVIPVSKFLDFFSSLKALSLFLDNYEDMSRSKGLYKILDPPYELMHNYRAEMEDLFTDIMNFGDLSRAGPYDRLMDEEVLKRVRSVLLSDFAGERYSDVIASLKLNRQYDEDTGAYTTASGNKFTDSISIEERAVKQAGRQINSKIVNQLSYITDRGFNAVWISTPDGKVYIDEKVHARIRGRLKVLSAYLQKIFGETGKEFFGNIFEPAFKLFGIDRIPQADLIGQDIEAAQVLALKRMPFNNTGGSNKRIAIEHKGPNLVLYYRRDGRPMNGIFFTSNEKRFQSAHRVTVTPDGKTPDIRSFTIDNDTMFPPEEFDTGLKEILDEETTGALSGSGLRVKELPDEAMNSTPQDDAVEGYFSRIKNGDEKVFEELAYPMEDEEIAISLEVLRKCIMELDGEKYVTAMLSAIKTMDKIMRNEGGVLINGKTVREQIMLTYQVALERGIEEIDTYIIKDVLVSISLKTPRLIKEDIVLAIGKVLANGKVWPRRRAFEVLTTMFLFANINPGVKDKVEELLIGSEVQEFKNQFPQNLHELAIFEKRVNDNPVFQMYLEDIPRAFIEALQFKHQTMDEKSSEIQDDKGPIAAKEVLYKGGYPDILEEQTTGLAIRVPGSQGKIVDELISSSTIDVSNAHYIIIRNEFNNKYVLLNVEVKHGLEYLQGHGADNLIDYLGEGQKEAIYLGNANASSWEKDSERYLERVGVKTHRIIKINLPGSEMWGIVFRPSTNQILVSWSGKSPKAYWLDAFEDAAMIIPSSSSFVIKDSADFKQRYLNASDNQQRVQLLEEEYGLKGVKIDVLSIKGGFLVPKGTGVTEKVGEHAYKLKLFGVEGDYEAYLLFHEFMHIILEEKGFRLNWDVQGREKEDFIFHIKNMMLDYIIEQENKRRFGNDFQYITGELRDTDLLGNLKAGQISPAVFFILALTCKVTTSFYPGLISSKSQGFIGPGVQVSYYDELIHELEKLSIFSPVSDWQRTVLSIYKLVLGNEAKLESGKLILNAQKLDDEIKYINEMMGGVFKMIKGVMLGDLQPQSKKMDQHNWHNLLFQLDKEIWPAAFRKALRDSIDLVRQKLDLRRVVGQMEDSGAESERQVLFMLNDLFNYAHLNINIWRSEKDGKLEILDDYNLLENFDFAMVDNLNKGGIDLSSASKELQTQNSGIGIEFHIDPAMFRQLQDAPGFVPVITKIQTVNLRNFLGLAVN